MPYHESIHVHVVLRVLYGWNCTITEPYMTLHTSTLAFSDRMVVNRGLTVFFFIALMYKYMRGVACVTACIIYLCLLLF